MGKHKSKEKWIELFKKYESKNWNWEEYYKKEVSFAQWTSNTKGSRKNISYKKRNARMRFRSKYKQWKILHNSFMNKSIETRGRKPKRNLDEIISNLTEQEKEDIVRRYLEITKEKDKKKEANKFKLK